MSRSNATRRYMLRSLGVAAVFLVTLYIAGSLIRGHSVSGPLAYGVALVPGFAMVAFFWANGKMIVEMEDEFLRMLAVRQQLIAMGFTMSVATLWGTLEILDLVPHVSAFYIIVVWSVGTIVGQVANLVTHGTGGGTCP